MSETVLYCRTANGGMEMINQQLESLRQYGKDKGYAIAAEYNDCNMNGTEINRPELQKLLNDIRAGKVKRIIVNDLSRLARNLLLFVELDRLFENNGVELISVKDSDFTDTAFNKEIS